MMDYEEPITTEMTILALVIIITLAVVMVGLPLYFHFAGI